MNNKIKVNADNIFPIIKKFLYSDHEIFLRELVSNASDAIFKIKTLLDIGELKNEDIYKKLKIDISINKNQKTLHILDFGIGMTKKEVEKYINQIAFSGAEEFIKKFKEKNSKVDNIIGHFGLGFYSSFMVADKVEIITKSYKKNSSGVHWVCTGSTEFNINEIEKKENGTEIILHINDDNKEFLQDYRIKELLDKYCKFMPFPIKFGKIEKTKKSKDGKEYKIKVDNIINNTKPIWIEKPLNIKDKDYIKFYNKLYPTQFENPLFWIHLNIDYPFKLTGVLFFPKIKNQIEIQKDKIQLYQNQVFVTDNLEGVVPEFLTLLKGIIDSPDIPLNVSRSYLQKDSSVKKISNYINRKVADKLNNLFKSNRNEFENKWEDMKIIIEYGMISNENFFEKVKDFYLLKDVDNKYYTFDDFTKKIKEIQKDKDNKIIYLYTSNKDTQHLYIKLSKDKKYEVLYFDSILTPHLIQKLENFHKNCSFVRVDSDHVDNLIKKDNINNLPEISKDDIKIITEIIEKQVGKNKYTIKVENLDTNSLPFMITVPEFIRRMGEMKFSNYNNMDVNKIPEIYNLIVNINHPLIKKILNTSNDNEKNDLIKKSIDLALISQNLLRGEKLSNFINNSYNNLYKL